MHRLAFIDHSFHKQSTATRFLIDLLKNYYHVDIYWDNLWKGEKNLSLRRLRKNNYDIIIFFQMMNYKPDELKSIGCDNIVLIPMYDGCFHMRISDARWKTFRPFKIINFSRSLHNRLIKLGLNSKCFQYFIPPEFDRDLSKPGFSTLKGFFWQRTSSVTWNHVKELIQNYPFSSFHIHKAIDPPGFDFVEPTREEKEKYGITISDWFEKWEDYFKLLKEANVFFAPRDYEGIGMSFLEAMAMGKCVVAPDNPTMNEYITDGENGFLYDLENPSPIDFSRAESIAGNARAYVERGYNNWLNSITELLPFINPSGSSGRKAVHLKFFRKILARFYEAKALSRKGLGQILKWKKNYFKKFT